MHQVERNAAVMQAVGFLVLILIGLAIGSLSAESPVVALLVAVVITALLIVVSILFKNGKLAIKRVVILLMFVSILLPSIKLPMGVPSVRPEFIVVLVAWGLLLLGYPATRYLIRIRRCPAYKWFGLFGFSIVLSMAYASWFKGQPLLGRDFWELAKVFLYFLICALVASQTIGPMNLKRYYKLALLVFVLSALMGFLQYIDFAGINEVVSPYYAPTQMGGLLTHGRINGTMPNPNEFGALMVLASSLALAGGLFFREQKLRMLSWVTLPVFGLAIVLTLSRSALASLFLAGTTVLFLFLRQKGLKRKSRRLLTFLLLSCVAGTFILQVIPEKTFYRYGEIATFTKATSWLARVANWKTHFSIWLESPWLGWGAGKANMGTIVDNEWLLLLRRYGVVGLAVFLGLFGSLFSGLAHIRKTNPDPSVVALSVALQSTFVGYALYMVLAGVYHSLQLMAIFLLFLGLAYSQWQPKRRIQEVPKP